MSITEAEIALYKKLGPLDVVFDVGCKKDNPFTAREVHQFDVKDVSNHAKGIFNQVAVGDYVGEITFYPEYESTIKRTDLTKPRWSWLTHESYMVAVTTIDEYCKQHNIKKIDLLKIDTEGGDLAVIHGAKTMLKNIRYIQFEEWPTIDIKEFKKILTGWQITKMDSVPVNYIATNEALL